MSQTEDPILFERVDAHIAVVTLNRPQARNAVNGALTEALDRRVRQIEDDPDIWVAILAGRGEQVFCAGADLKELAAGRGASLVTENGGFAGFVYAPRHKPWIAAVRGAALGGGLELALACDLIVCGGDSALGLPEVKRGLIAGAGGLIRLPRVIPRALALEMIATGRPLSAARAAEIGLVNAVVEPAQVLDRALDLAREICNNAPIAVRESLRIARETSEHPLGEMRERSSRSLQTILASEDFREGPRAFIERRPPNWSGR